MYACKDPKNPTTTTATHMALELPEGVEEEGAKKRLGVLLEDQLARHEPPPLPAHDAGHVCCWGISGVGG